MYDVEIITTPRIHVAALAHQGDYNAIGRTFDRLIGLATAAGLLREQAPPEVSSGGRAFGIYYDDPATKPLSELRSEACLLAPDGFSTQGDLRALDIAGGRYARIEHVGPYAELKRAYSWLYGAWLTSSGEETADRPCVEEYLNDPRQVPAAQLRTTVWLPLK
jgi:AraC family transcriptional regulator